MCLATVGGPRSMGCVCLSCDGGVVFPDRKSITLHYLSTYFIIDLVSLPPYST